MTDMSYSPSRGQSPVTKIVLRFVLYVLLGLFALFYLMPLFVMITTSLKSLEEIRTGDLVSLPREVTFDAWRTAWSGACTGIQCEGVQPYFLNSLLIAIPAVMISTVVGALNGYVVAQWKFKGANIFFALMLFGCFIPFQVVLLPMARVLGLMGIIWQFTQIWNDFLFGVSFSQAGTQPVTVALNNIVNSTTGVKEYNVDMAAAIIAALPTLFVYVVAGKYFIRGLTAGSVKG